LTTTDRPSVEERYITAKNGADVKSAAGMAAANSEEKDRVVLALLLWSVTYEGKTEKKRDLADKLGMHLNKRMARDRRLKGDAWKIGKEMLTWHIHGTCTACDGRGYEAIQGTPSLSDNLCHHCHGTGKRPYPREAAHVWLAGELQSLTALASGEVMKRLAKSMDL
jgi:hypothetical protein